MRTSRVSGRRSNACRLAPRRGASPVRASKPNGAFTAAWPAKAAQSMARVRAARNGYAITRYRVGRRGSACDNEWPNCAAKLRRSEIMRLKMLLLATSIYLAGPAFADEGMWTPDNFPYEQVNQKYGLHLDQKWLERVQAGAVRL